MTRRKIYILLTKFPDFSSRVVELLTGCYYTHASIGLEEDMNTFYSFVCKGFIVEKITRYIRPDRAPLPCQLYELEVPQEEYDQLKQLLDFFVGRKSALRYAKLGLALSLMRIPYKRRRHHYFCSQFVAEVLSRGSSVPLSKRSNMYFPGDFRRLPGMQLNFQGDLQKMIKCYKISPYMT